jgi:hypothetical protein
VLKVVLHTEPVRYTAAVVRRKAAAADRELEGVANAHLDALALAADTVRKPVVVEGKDFGDAANGLGDAEDILVGRTAAVAEVDTLGEDSQDLVARSRTAAAVAAAEADMEAAGRRSLAGLRIHQLFEQGVWMLRSSVQPCGGG